MAELTGVVSRGQQGSSSGQGSGNSRAIMLNSLGQQVVMDWKQKAILDGSVYMIEAGVLTTAITGDGTAITTTAAEMAVSIPAATAIIPFEARISVDFHTADATEVMIGAVTVVASGTAFTPLPLRSDGPSGGATAHVAGTGAVTVPADAVTTTLQLYRASGEGGVAEGDTLVLPQVMEWQPLAGPVLVGARCWYIAIALCTYYAQMTYADYDADLISR